MAAIICMIGASALAWHGLFAWLYRRELSSIGHADYPDSATSAAGKLLQVIVLGFGGLWFFTTHARALDMAPGPIWSAILSATLGKWIVDVAYMLRSRVVDWYDLFHHALSGVMIAYVLWNQTIAWFLALAVFVAELPGMGYFATKTVVRIRVEAPATLFALRCLHFVVAGTIWIFVIPALTVWYVHESGYDRLTATLCLGYNVFTVRSAYKLVTRTPRTLRELASELMNDKRNPASSRTTSTTH